MSEEPLVADEMELGEGEKQEATTKTRPGVTADDRTLAGGLGSQVTGLRKGVAGWKIAKWSGLRIHSQEASSELDKVPGNKLSTGQDWKAEALECAITETLDQSMNGLTHTALEQKGIVDPDSVCQLTKRQLESLLCAEVSEDGQVVKDNKLKALCDVHSTHLIHFEQCVVCT